MKHKRYFDTVSFTIIPPPCVSPADILQVNFMGPQVQPIRNCLILHRIFKNASKRYAYKLPALS